MKPSVTVLMALYNGGPYLAGCVKSVLEQTYKDFEFLIINDCSTDDSVNIIGSFRDPRVRIHHHQQNLGQTRSLNVGLGLAKGEWIARIDADDIALKFWLEKHMKFVQAKPQFAVVSADAVVIDEHDKVQKCYASPVERDEIILRSFFNSPLNHVGCIMNKQAILEAGGYDEKYKTVADYDLWKKLICADRPLTSLGEVCVAIRRHGASLSVQDLSDKYLREVAEITLPILSKFTRANLDLERNHKLIRAIYSPEKLTPAEFDEAAGFLKAVVGKINTALFDRPETPRHWSKRIAKTLYYKRIHAMILKKDYRQVRHAAFKGMAELGGSNLFLYFVLMSFLGGIFLDFVPAYFAWVSRFKMRRFIGQRKLGHDFR